MRLFTGIAIPPRVLSNLASVLEELRPLAPLRWSPVENLHITSKFIGEWPDARLRELEAALQTAVLETMLPAGGFEISIARFGYFPNPHNPRTLFAGIRTGPALAKLASDTEEALRPLGVAKEDRPYSPHLTLARITGARISENIRELREHIANMTNFDFGTFQVSEFHLYLSKSTPSGSIYKSLSTYKLTAASMASRGVQEASRGVQEASRGVQK